MRFCDLIRESIESFAVKFSVGIASFEAKSVLALVAVLMISLYWLFQYCFKTNAKENEYVKATKSSPSKSPRKLKSISAGRGFTAEAEVAHSSEFRVATKENEDFRFKEDEKVVAENLTFGERNVWETNHKAIVLDNTKRKGGGIVAGDYTAPGGKTTGVKHGGYTLVGSDLNADDVVKVLQAMKEQK